MSTESSPLSPNKQALLAIRELKQQLAEAQQVSGEPIAIVSMACRFPRRSRTPEQFWQCLLDQTDEVSEIPEDRWDLDAFFDEDPEVPGKMYARKGVFLDDLDQMDPEFFGISPREATWVDPQQRLLMEVGWEALERAGWQTEKIGANTGIFVGWMHNDYQNEASDSFLNLNPYIATGAAGSFLCGRLAYFLGLEGPSVAVDTACSSSLVALHLAIQSLQRRDCDRALVGGVNAIVSPTTNILTCKLKALSPQGHSRAFDAAADGYLRGEGCGVVALRRLSEAEQDGDPILGVIRGSAVGHNGFSSGLTAPNPKAQEKVIRQALDRAGIKPSEVAYLEAHGTGTELGDPIELQAAAAALAADRDTQQPLLVGSVKTNIGHLEAAAGMAGLIKVLLAIENQQIPAQLNFDDPNPYIPWDKLPVQVVTEPVDWPQNGARRVAGVSAFGMSGTNAHVVIEAPPQANTKTSDRSAQAEPQILVLSAKNEAALEQLGEAYRTTLAGKSAPHWTDMAYTSGVGRDHHQQRAAVVANSGQQAAELLRTLSRGGQAEGLVTGNSRKTPRIAWQFTGQGSQYVGMARGLYDAYETFRASLDQCDRLLREWRGESLLEVMFEHPQRIDHTSWTQPAIFAVQMGLAKLLENWGLQPDAVMGHSVGQYAAACVAGIMSWEDGLRLISERGRLIGELPTGGRMLAVFAPPEKVEQSIAELVEVSLAALNGTHVVVSGPESAVARVESHFEQQGVRTKALVTSHAFHSAMMDPVLEPFERCADSVSWQTARLPLVCNVSGEVLPVDARLDGRYWAQHIRQPVRFAPGVAALQELGCEVVLELGPQAVLSRMAAANWKQDANCLVSCLQRDVEDVEAVLRAVARLYVEGAKPDFAALFAGQECRRTLLPTYPFQRRRFWGPDKPGAFHSAYHTAHPLLGSEVSLAGMAAEKRYESFVEPDSPAWLPDHQVVEQVVMPGAAFVEMALAAADGKAIAELSFQQPLRPTSRTAMQTVVRTPKDGVATIETYSQTAGGTSWSANFAAQIDATPAERPAELNRAEIEARCAEVAEPADFYRKMQQLGLNYGAEFQTIQSIRYSQTEVLTKLSARSDVRGYELPPTVLDGALHSLAVGLLRADDDELFLPRGIGRVVCFEPIVGDVWCHAVWTQSEGKSRTADLVLFDDSGRALAEIRELRVQQLDRAAFRKLSGTGAERLIHQLHWEPTRLPAANTDQKRWLLVDHGQGQLANQVKERLEQAGHEVATVLLSSSATAVDGAEQRFTLNPEDKAHWAEAFDQLGGDAPYAPAGICWFVHQPAGPISAAEQLPADSQADGTGLLNLVALLGERGIQQVECGLQLVTANAIATTEGAPASAQQTQYWGLGRVIGAEQPTLHCRLIDIESQHSEQAQTAEAVCEILVTDTSDNQFAIRAEQLFVPRMRQARVSRTSGEFAVEAGKSFLITGGLGKLGRQAAKWLADLGAQQVVLVSRREPDEATREFLDAIENVGCQVEVQPASLSSRADVSRLFSRFGNELLPLGGVIHAAGVLDDGLLADQTWERFEKVLAPKVVGAALLDEFTRPLELDFFILYSSAASVLGSPGQSNYAMANAYLDGLAWQRRAANLPATSINWGPWTEGMADDERILKRLALQGIAPLAVGESHEALAKLLTADLPQTTVIDVQWQRMRSGLGGQVPSVLAELMPTTRRKQGGDSELVGKLKKLRGGEQRELLLATIQGTLQQILSSSDAPDTDRPLIEMGLDSLMAVEFGTELQQLLGEGIDVGPTMFFEHPTLEAITDYLLEMVVGDGSEEQAQANVVAPPVIEMPQAADDIAIVGMSCRFPGARNVDQYWDNLLQGVDSVREIPHDRWDVERFYSAEPQPGKMISREGGFLEDIADFDAEFFNISALEACWIDPQHRMLLENSHHALENAGIATQPLADANVGVFMGIMGQDYAFLPRLGDDEIIAAFQGAGLSHSAGVGRISYLFGFEGPSVAVDTASSSSLVAVLQAVRSLQDGDCNLALAGGVNAILVPVNSLLMSKAGLMAPDGRCKSFSAQANGFGRGEGCGVVVLKRLSDARRDNDRVLAVIRGGAVVHNGTSGGITSPSGRSQSRMIADALQNAGVAPGQVQYLEAHGTGTEFGDAMELGAAAGVYGKGRKPDEPLLVGSAKANISHLEAAGGISGLIKTVMALHTGVIPPQLHFTEPSAHIPWNRMPVKVVEQTTNWPETDERIAAITALGLVGTNAHVILSSGDSSTEEVPATDAPAPEPAAMLLPISARSESALAELAGRFQSFVEQHPETSLTDVCHTAGIGRRHYEQRRALVAESRAELLEQLAKLAGGTSVFAEASTNGHFHTNGSATEKTPAAVQTTGTPKVAWLFSGSAADDLSLAQELASSEPTFRATIEEFDQRLAEHFADAERHPPRLAAWLSAEASTAPTSEVQLFALQAGLARLWQAWGIEPDGVLGFGVGQYAAACAAGGLCYKDAVVLIAERESVLAAPESEREPALDRFEAIADQFNYYPPNLPLVCSQSGEVVPVHRSLGGSYWRQHCTEAGNRVQAWQSFAELNPDFVVGLGPAASLEAAANEFAELSEAQFLGSLAEGQRPGVSLRQSLGRLYEGGVTVNFQSLVSGVSPRRLGLPGYPFQKKRYWITEVAEHFDQQPEPITS